MSVTSPAAWANSCVQGGCGVRGDQDRTGLHLVEVVLRQDDAGGCGHRSGADGETVERVAGRVVPDLGLLEPNGRDVAGLLGNRPGRVQELARFPELAPLRREFAQFRKARASLARLDGPVQLIGHHEERIFRVEKRPHVDQTPTQLECHWPQHGPGVAKIEGRLFADVVVSTRKPQTVSELPVGESRELL